MTSRELSDEVALRIALATRELRDTDNRGLLEVLFGIMGKPITVRKLSRLRFNALYKALEASHNRPTEESVRQALSYLRGKGIKCEEPPLPPVSSYREGEMPQSVRICFTSDNGHMVDGQFATCERYLIYQVSADEYRLIDIRELTSGKLANSLKSKRQLRADMVADCNILCTTLIGASAASKVVQSGIHPIVIDKPIPAAVFIREFQQVLSDSPPPWIAKVMGVERVMEKERRHWHAE